MQNDIGALIKQINDRLQAELDAALKDGGITASQLRVLVILNESDKTVTQKDIETILGVSHPTVTGLVSRLENNGFVETYFDPLDKRNKIVRLTNKSRELSQRVQFSPEIMEKRLSSNITPHEKETLIKLLIKVRDSMY